MADDDRSEEQRSSADAPGERTGPGRAPGVPAEQRGAADEGLTPGPEPVGERSGGAGAAAGAGAPLESPGGPGTVAQREEPDEEKTLAEELVEEGPPVEV